MGTEARRAEDLIRDLSIWCTLLSNASFNFCGVEVESFQVVAKRDFGVT